MARLRLIIGLEVLAIIMGVILLTKPVLPTISVFKKIQQMVSGKPISKLDHIVVLVMENRSSDDIINKVSVKYINSLIKRSSLAYNYFAVSHPSLPNYLSLIGGSTYNVRTDCVNCFQSAPNLIDQIEAAGKSWRAYMESMPKACYLGNFGLYVQKHNPFIYFNNIRKNEERCNKIVPYSKLSDDLKSTETTPNFIWISPNNCHNMHDCSTAEGDNWLSVEIPKILNSPSFTRQNSLLVVVWDEADGSGDNRVPMILVGPQIKSGYISDVRYDHYSLLRTIEVFWGLPPLTENDQRAEAMKEFFN